MTAWEVLGIEETGDERAIKRAYAKRLKVTRPDDDAHGFQLLRDAYEFALRMAAYLRDQEGESAGAADVPISAPGPDPLAVSAPAPLADDISPVGVAVFHDAHYQPTASAPDARDIAQGVWAAFLQVAAVAPRHQLQAMAASEAMLSLDVRDHVELCAVSYCATDACDDDLREVIAEHFEWASDMALVRRELPRQAADTVERLRAAESYRQFTEHARNNPTTAALLADSPGRAFPRAWNRKFVLDMRGLLAAVRWHHREMLVFKLNEEVVDTWSRRVEKRRYFLQTALWSLGAAIILSMVAAGILGANEMVERYIVWSTLGCFAVALAGGAGIEHLLANPTVSTWRERLLHEWRYLPAVQFGWIGALGVLGMLFLIPEPPALVTGLGALLAVGCVLVACVANSAVLNGFAFTLSILFGIGIGLGIEARGQGDFGILVYSAAATAALQLFYRGGSDLWAWLNTPDVWIARMRVAWLSATVAVYGLAGYSNAAPPLLHFLAGALVLAGMLLSRPTIHPLVGLAGGVALRVFAAPLMPDGFTLRGSPLAVMFMMLTALVIFMAVNMKRSAEHQQQFA